MSRSDDLFLKPRWLGRGFLPHQREHHRGALFEAVRAPDPNPDPGQVSSPAPGSTSTSSSQIDTSTSTALPEQTASLAKAQKPASLANTGDPILRQPAAFVAAAAASAIAMTALALAVQRALRTAMALSPPPLRHLLPLCCSRHSGVSCFAGSKLKRACRSDCFHMRPVTILTQCIIGFHGVGICNAISFQDGERDGDKASLSKRDV